MSSIITGSHRITKVCYIYHYRGMGIIIEALFCFRTRYPSATTRPDLLAATDNRHDITLSEMNR